MRGSSADAAVRSTAVCVLFMVACATGANPSDGSAGALAGGAPGAGAGGSAGTRSTTGGATTGGTTATGGTTTGGASTGGTASGGTSNAGAGGSIPHAVGACDALAPAGTFEQVTPPDVLKYLPPNGPGSPDGQLAFGVQAIGLDPTTDGTVYLGTCKMGIWKSTDCGSTWSRINTGKNGNVVDQGAQTTLVIDPVNPKIVYTDSFYGQNGAFKSSDGGVNWEQFWPPSNGTLQDVVEYNFVAGITLDPWDHLHMLVAFHAKCKAPYSAACVAETTDGGGSWRIINGDASWVGGEGTSVYFLDNGHTLLFGSQSNGLWRSTNTGASWQPIQGAQVSHGAGQLYRTQSGTFYLGVADGILRSDTGVNWSMVTGTGHGIPTMGVIGDGTNLYASVGFPWNPGTGPAAYEPFYTAPESTGQNWKQLPSPKLIDGGYLALDRSHHLLYSTNLYAGFFRVVLQ